MTAHTFISVHSLCLHQLSSLGTNLQAHVLFALACGPSLPPGRISNRPGRVGRSKKQLFFCYGPGLMPWLYRGACCGSAVDACFHGRTRRRVTRSVTLIGCRSVQLRQDAVCALPLVDDAPWKSKENFQTTQFCELVWQCQAIN